MCGVVGLISEHVRADLGQMASTLLRSLEYRGYDSTGAAIQGDDPTHIDLRKGVGAPSFLVKDLGIEELAGRIVCGQVRWATFGAVDKVNAQPHIVRCKTLIYGAHNGNVTNTDQLGTWLRKAGHTVLSDNDGEMVVHTIEHFFALELERLDHPLETLPRRDAMRRAIVLAQQELEGSFAAIVIDPLSKTGWAIKSGSSLYAGLGMRPENNFNLASSDLTSILKFTKVLIPLSEGEVFEFSHNHYSVFAARRITRMGPGRVPVTIEPGAPIERLPVRSKLLPKDTELRADYTYFMEQEIHDQSITAEAVIRKFLGGSDFTLLTTRIMEQERELFEQCTPYLAQMVEATTDEELRAIFTSMREADLLAQITTSLTGSCDIPTLPLGNATLAARFASGEAALLADLLPWCRTPEERLAVRALDAWLELREVTETKAAALRFAELVQTARQGGNHIYLAACGTSYHAAMTACIFFNEIAYSELIPILPGEFRARYSHTVKDNDLVIAISQSGETKDLVDILNDIERTGRDVTRIAIVNNVNSTIAQEKSDLVIPLRCGPEIAVPATKSFINQITVFYTLALEVARLQLHNASEEWSAETIAKRGRDLASRTEKLREIPSLITETIKSCEADVEEAAKRIYLAPSIQILATRINPVAREGSLKIREVVLNHTEGFEGAEFKHGPNTILGFNTVFGPEHLSRITKAFTERILQVAAKSDEDEISLTRLIPAMADQLFGSNSSFSLTRSEQQLLKELSMTRLITDETIPYPLIYITGPEERDVRLTISQINTHKIRGSSTIVVAEENSRLRLTAEKIPMGADRYWATYITLPRTGDTLLTLFSSTVALQMLALKMSIRKMEYLDRINIEDHGVHPDVPKNVSKSITVD